MVYEDGEVQRTIHVNHAKPAKFTIPDLPEPVPAPETPRPPLGHLPAGLARPRPPTPAPAANHNSAFQEADSVTRLRSTANDNSPLTGNQPGYIGSNRITPVEHPQTFLLPQHQQHPRFWTNQNAERRFDLDHPEFLSVYKPAQPSIQQDYTKRSRRDSFSGSGLSSPALQRSHRDSFSGSPVGHLSGKKSLTDPQREVRIAGGSRPGLVFPLPRAACPVTRLVLDATPPEAAALSRAERPPTVLDILGTGRLEDTRCPEPSQRRGSSSPRCHSRKRPRNRSSGVYRPKKRSPHRGHWCEYLASPWYEQEIT